MKYIEIWNVMKQLSAGFVVIILIAGAGTCMKLYAVFSWRLIFLIGFGSLLMSLLMAKQSSTFENWKIIDLDNFIDKFI